MKYARMADGIAVEIIEPAFDEEGNEIPITERFHPALVSTFIPFDPDNPPPGPSSEPMPAPRQVTMRQARLALLTAGKLQGVAAALDALTGMQKEAAQIEWEFAATVDRESPLVELLGNALQLDDAALDALFIQAAGFR